jgi:hypothetical protein
MRIQLSPRLLGASGCLLLAVTAACANPVASGGPIDVKVVAPAPESCLDGVFQSCDEWSQNLVLDAALLAPPR